MIHWQTYIQEVIDKDGDLERAIRLAAEEVNIPTSKVRQFAEYYLDALAARDTAHEYTIENNE